MRDLTQGNIFKVILLFTLPIFLGSLVGQVNMIIDSVIVGRSVGKEALAAVGAVFPFIFIMVSVVTGISIGSNILLAQYYGAKESDMVKKIIETNIVFLFFASLFVTLTGIILCPYIFELINIPDDVMPYAVIYCRVYFAGITFMFFTNTIQAMLRSMGDSKTPFYFVVVTNLLNILFNLIFVLWLRMGIYGVAFAVVLSYLIVFGGLMHYFFKYQKHISISLKHLSFNIQIFVKSFKIGFPVGMQTLILALAMNSVFSIVNNFGTDAVAAYTAGGRIDSIMFMFAMDIAMGFSAFVGQNIGANKFDRLKKGIIASLIISSVPVGILSVLSVLSGNWLISIFTTDATVISYGARYLLIVSGFYLICSTTYILGSVFNGAGRTILTLIATIIGWWVVRIPVSYYLSKTIGVDAIWWGISMQWVAEFIFILILFFIGKWKNKISLQTI